MVIGSKVIYRDSLESTNNFASGMIKQEMVPEGTVIHAGYQSAGRGQHGNKWESEAGKNLLLSIILYPVKIKPEEQFILSMAISMGILDFVRSLVKGVSIKWPNDIYAGKRKIAGILIENSILDNTITHTIAGIGLNVNQTEFPRHLPNPVSVKMITGREYDLKESLKHLLARLDRRYRQLYSHRNLILKNEYISSLYGFMELKSFKTAAGELRGRITSVSPEGQLVVVDESDNVHYFGFKEIEFM